MRKNRLVLPVVLVMFGALVFGAATATAEKPQQEDVGALIKALTERLEAQDKKISSLESKLTDEALQTARQEEIAKIVSDMRQDASKRGILPEWLENLRFYGDFRLRYEFWDRDGAQPPPANAGSWKERHRLRYQLRFGFEKTWLDDQMKVNFRLATSQGGAITSRNQTATGAFAPKAIWLDLAYAQYTPNAIPGLTLIGGKQPVPVVHSDMTFDSDVTPEGIAGAYTRKIPQLGGIEAFAIYAHFVLNEMNQGGQGAPGALGLNKSGGDSVINVYQAGFNTDLPCGIKGTFAGSWYDTENYEDLGLVNNSWNRNMQIVNAIAVLKFKALGFPWKVYGDFLHNESEHDQTADTENADDGYAFGAQIGENKKQGDWSANYKWAYIEANAFPGALNDADFGAISMGPVGGCNRKGHVLRGTYNLTDDLTARSSFFLTEPVLGNSDEEDLIIQFDLKWKF